MGCHTWFYRRGFKAENKSEPSRIRVKGHWYVQDTKRPVTIETQNNEVFDYHDAFRIGGYPDDILLSLNETIEFIKKHKIEKVDWDYLKEFWCVYPDGMIRFG